MSIRTVGSLSRLARRTFIAGSGSFAEATFVPGCAAAQRITSYELPVAGNGARSFHSGYTPSSFTYPRVGALVAFAAIASSSFLYTMGAGKEASCQQETGEEETGEWPGFRWDKFDEYMSQKDAELPEYVDWEEARAVTPSINQLKCGACGAIATISSVESLYQMKTGKLVRFSPQQLVDCLGSDGCDGCSPREAYQYGLVRLTPYSAWLLFSAGTVFFSHNNSARTVFFSQFQPKFCQPNGAMSREGVILDDDYPYTGIFGPCRSKGLPVAARINGYFNVYVGGDERELMRAVAKQPVEVTICATGRFVNLEGDRTLEPEDFAIREDTVYNHSVLLVGYGVDEDGPYWKIKNSWGPTWGNRGFAKLRRGVKDPNGTGGMTRPGAFVFFPVMD